MASQPLPRGRRWFAFQRWGLLVSPTSPVVLRLVHQARRRGWSSAWWAVLRRGWGSWLLTGLLGVPLSDKSGTVPTYPGSAGRGGDVGALP